MKVTICCVFLLYSLVVNSLELTDEQVADYAFISSYNASCEKLSIKGKRLYLKDINTVYGSLEGAFKDDKFSNAVTNLISLKFTIGKSDFCDAGKGGLMDTGNYNRLFK